jgi:(p)ppGpp synthase/HD superfamily hydrolase
LNKYKYKIKTPSGEIVKDIMYANSYDDLTKLITTDFSINMRSISIQSHDGIFEGRISLYVKDIDSLNVLLDNIRAIKGIESVKRLLNT